MSANGIYESSYVLFVIHACSHISYLYIRCVEYRQLGIMSMTSGRRKGCRLHIRFLFLAPMQYRRQTSTRAVALKTPFNPHDTRQFRSFNSIDIVTSQWHTNICCYHLKKFSKTQHVWFTNRIILNSWEMQIFRNLSWDVLRIYINRYVM